MRFFRAGGKITGMHEGQYFVFPQGLLICMSKRLWIFCFPLFVVCKCLAFRDIENSTGIQICLQKTCSPETGCCMRKFGYMYALCLVIKLEYIDMTREQL